MNVQDGVLTQADPQRIGDWTILARLGAGGMGVVYLGERAGRRAAIKTIHHDLAVDESFRKRFEREASAMSTAQSPHVARVLEADVDSSPPYIAFRFHDGPNLREVIKDGGPLDPPALQALAMGLAEGLSAIHDQGVVHRDIKPSNIIMTHRGPVIIDFGIASYKSADMTQLTVTGEPVGSPTWMSPEYITTGHAAEPGDVFGWASTLQFAATGMPPFGIGAPQPLLYRITNAEPTPHRIPGSLGQLISQSLAKNPVDRPSVTKILHTLDPHGARPVSGATEPVEASRSATPTAEDYAQARTRKVGIVAIMLSLALAVPVAILFLLWPAGDRDVPPSLSTTAELTPTATPPLPTPGVTPDPTPNALQPLLNLLSGPAFVTDDFDVELFENPTPQSSVIGWLSAGSEVFVEGHGYRYNGVPHVYVRNGEQEGYVNRTLLTFLQR